MKIHILSDLHLEHADYEPAITDADVVVLAGDIGVGCQGVAWAKQMFYDVPVLYVPGNHEFHDSVFTMDEHVRSMQHEAEQSQVAVLNNTTFELAGVRFIGSTLWSDVQDAPDALYCDQVITVDDDLTHLDKPYVQQLFSANVAWLSAELAKPFEGHTVVITHHAPSLESVHPQYVGNEWNPCFVSNVESLMPNVDLWIHGHTHNHFDYVIGGKTRVVCNPRGYPNPLGNFENMNFKPDFMVNL